MSHICQLKTLDSVQTWKLLKKFHQNFIIGTHFLNHGPNIKVFVKLFSKSLQGVGRSPTVLCWRYRVWDGVPRFYVGGAGCGTPVLRFYVQLVHMGRCAAWTLLGNATCATVSISSTYLEILAQTVLIHLKRYAYYCAYDKKRHAWGNTLDNAWFVEYTSYIGGCLYMLSIIICDDDKFMMEMSASAVQQCIAKGNYDARIACMTQDATELLAFIKKNPNCTPCGRLYFLDIDLGRANLNGVDIARLIKKQEPTAKIVFVTSHADMGMSILKSGVEAFGFIEKTANKSKILNEYKKYIHMLCAEQSHIADAQDDASVTHMSNADTDVVRLLIGIDEYISIPISQILYVDTDKTVSHFVRYHTVDGSDISVRDTIENVLQKLGESFMKSHRSVIINKNYVVSVSDGVVNFASGEKADCSFRLRSNVMKACDVKKV